MTTLNDFFGVLIDSLENERFFFLDSDVTVESLIKIFMMADLAWIKQPNRNREEFLKLHWNVLYAFLTEKGVKELKTFLS